MERIKCGTEVGLASPNSKELVALGKLIGKLKLRMANHWRITLRYL